MAAINEVTNLEVESNIAVLTLNSPPVNALSANVREGLHVGVKQAIEDVNVKYGNKEFYFKYKKHLKYSQLLKK